MNFNLKGKTAIIGGSSKGLGKACAVALAREGANIVLCARNKDILLKTQKEMEWHGVQVLSLAVDMANADDNERIVRETVSRFGGIDILVNNSGGPKPGTFRDVSEEALDDAYHSVLKYNIRMIQLCLPYMEKKGWGRIVNITSVTVKEPSPNMVLSNIFRAAVVSFAKTISKELISKGVTINNVCPGYFRTDRVTQLMEVGASNEGISVAEYEQKAIAGFPHKRYMDPQELGDLVCYLCSDQGRSINGTTLQIDGGTLNGLL
jgi:Dehydrogenases with different specificities (related to short-chain alcohol dehydrogenases)